MSAMCISASIFSLRSALARSPAVVSLTLSRLPATSRTAAPYHSETAASSVKSERSDSAAARWAARIGAKWKPWGCLRRPDTGTRHGPGDMPVFRLGLQGLDGGKGGDRALAVGERQDDVVDHGRGDEGAHRVVNEHDVRRGREGRKGIPARTAPRPAGSHRPEPSPRPYRPRRSPRQRSHRRRGG